jgi:hypothetical protein
MHGLKPRWARVDKASHWQQSVWRGRGVSACKLASMSLSHLQPETGWCSNPLAGPFAGQPLTFLPEHKVVGWQPSVLLCRGSAQVLFACLQGTDAFVRQPYHQLRHPMIFYYGGQLQGDINWLWREYRPAELHSDLCLLAHEFLKACARHGWPVPLSHSGLLHPPAC